MGKYGITALSGLSGSMDRQEERQDNQAQREWAQESQKQQRKQWDQADEEFEAGKGTRDLARSNDKIKLLIQKGDLERKQMFQKLAPAFQAVNVDDGNKDDHGQAMAQILSGVNAKEIEYIPSSTPDDVSFQFKSKDGKVYNFKDFEDARAQIGATFSDPVEFLKKRSEALSEKGLWVTADGNIVEKKRGDAEREGLTPYSILEAQGKLSAIGRQNRDSYDTVNTGEGIMAVNKNDPNDTRRIGSSPVSAADRNVYGTVNTGDGVMAFNKYNPSDTRRIGSSPVSASDRAARAENPGKITKQFKDDLAFVLTPFVKPGEALLDSEGNFTNSAQNALASAQSFYEKNQGKEATLSSMDKMTLDKAKNAIQMYNGMSQTVTDRYYGEEENEASASPKALGNGSPAPSPGAGALSSDTPAPTADKPPEPGARKAPNGNWYIPDPNRPGKYIKTKTGVAQ